MAENGREYGTTTGRRRRCGWLDLVVLKHSLSINGYTSLNLTKLDVLDDLPQVRVAVAYRHRGKVLSYFPADLRVLSEVEVDYESFEGWRTPIAKCKRFKDLPHQAKVFVSAIEEYLGVPVTFIGVGPGRYEVIAQRNAPNPASWNLRGPEVPPLIAPAFPYQVDRQDFLGTDQKGQ